MPESSGEIVISSHIRTNGSVDIKVGETLKLEVGERVSQGYELAQENPYSYEEEFFSPKEERTYTVVGIIERPNEQVEGRMAPGYSVFTCLDEEIEACELELFVDYTDWGLKHAEQVTAGILGVSEDLYERYYVKVANWSEEEEEQITRVARTVSENYWLLKWITFSFSSGTMNMIYGMALLAVLVIIVTSVFCIRNSFVISLTEKMKLYGRLASVGTTSKQQKKIIYYETGFLGMVGIPLGILGGLLAEWILVKTVGGLFQDALGMSLIFVAPISAVLIGAILSTVTVFLSAFGSALRAAKVSPISAIRSNDTVKTGRKELKCPKYVGRLFGTGGTIAYRNLKRARVKYRTTVVSITISVAVFIGMSTFVQLMRYA